MIERHVYLKLVEATEADRRELLCRAAALESVVVGRPADPPSAAAWDLALRIERDDPAQLAAFLQQPAWTEFVNELSARKAVIKAWSFERS